MSNREWWDRHREQFERTDRVLRRLIGAVVVFGILAFLIAWAFYYLYWTYAHSRS